MRQIPPMRRTNFTETVPRPSCVLSNRLVDSFSRLSTWMPLCATKLQSLQFLSFRMFTGAPLKSRGRNQYWEPDHHRAARQCLTRQPRRVACTRHIRRFQKLQTQLVIMTTHGLRATPENKSPKRHDGEIFL